ncbi:hypothetical protein BXY82_2738 [Gelidibacter sediminis]|uniref:GDSL-like lipase/acylhydrolase family protein n=1 Tax=Gelidibacter sediminis TaxID=1608710 RepID=A0A4R7PJC3_9FLAO|nr:hypothetical protein [Gelidibacter sediminis]TDU34417.1 hypothetical protein BXY82_2738 [Gelidibacter sediminis]
MKPFLKNVGIIVLITVALSALLSTTSLWSLRQSNFYKPSFLANSITEDSFDYIILGASTGLTTLNTNVIDSIVGTVGLNLAMDDTSLATQYVMLEHFIALGKSTTYCILAPSNTSYDVINNRLSNNDYRFLPYVQNEYVYQHYSQYAIREAKLLQYSKFMPMLGVAYYNSEVFYPSINALLYPEKRNRFDERGNYTYPGKNAENSPIVSKDTFEVDFSNPYMKAIKSLCDKQGIQLICYLTPMKEKSVKIINNDYLVLNHSDSLSNTRYFFDGIHVNSTGRVASSLLFAEQFIKLKNLPFGE